MSAAHERGDLTMEYEFEELPLLVAGETKAGLVNGMAEIGGTIDEWWIDDIYFAGYAPDGKRRWVKIDSSSEVYKIIYDRLLKDYRDYIWDGLELQDAWERDA
jgi:hypothetical protein